MGGAGAQCHLDHGNPGEGWIGDIVAMEYDSPMHSGHIEEASAGRYRIIEELGEGGFGVTYRAERVSDGLPVVVKYLQMSRVPDWKAVELFEREAEVLQKLSHPRIPGYIDHGVGADGISADGDVDAARAPFIVQEYIEGRRVDEAMQGREFDAAWVTTMVRDLLGVLEYLHGRVPPVIHRDIKPSNVLVDEAGRAYLIDFGTVRAVFRDEGSTTAGTFGYAAPEQFVGRASPASDLYGLGMTALTALSGKAPEELAFEGNRVDVDAVLPAGSVPARLKRMIAQMTEPNPDERPASAGEVLRRLAGMPVTGERLEVDEVDTQAIQVWYDALYRLDRTEPMSGVPTWFERSMVYTRFDEAGRWAFAYSPMRADILRLSDFSIWQVEATPGESFAAFSPGGETLVLFDRGRGTVTFYDLADGDFDPEPVSTSVYEGDFSSFDLEVRVGPDAATAAVWSSFEEDAVRLVDRTGRVFQTIRQDEIGDVVFTPDSSAIVVCADYHLHVYGRDGSHRTVAGQRVAFSPDGRYEAIVHGSKIEVRRVAGAYLAANESSATRDSYVVRDIRWSADSHALLTVEAFADLEGDFVVVSDADLNATAAFGSAGRPGGITHISDASIAYDGRTVWVSGVDFWTRLVSDTYPGMASFDITSGEVLGTYSHFITMADENEDPIDETAAERPMFNAADGFVYIDPRIEDANQNEAAMRLMRGEDPELSADERLAWQDMRVRLAFIDDLFEFGELDRGDNPAPIVRASTGFTHMLPAALLRARQSGGATFGPSDSSGVTVDAIEAALQDIAAMSSEEQKVVFEDSIEAIRKEPLFGARPQPSKSRALVPLAAPRVSGVPAHAGVPEVPGPDEQEGAMVESARGELAPVKRLRDTALRYVIMLIVILMLLGIALVTFF